MNKRNAVFVVHSDLVVIACTLNHCGLDDRAQFAKALELGWLKEYTYCAREGWLPDDLKPGTRLIVPARGKLQIARFVRRLDETALDLDSESLQYQWMVGRSLDDLTRWQEANAFNAEILVSADRARINALREQVKTTLAITNEK